jgi:hypothetical protein
MYLSSEVEQGRRACGCRLADVCLTQGEASQCRQGTSVVGVEGDELEFAQAFQGDAGQFPFGTGFAG